MMDILVPALSGVVGSIGFCLVMRSRLRRMPIISLSAAVCCALYLIVIKLGLSDFFAAALAALLATALSECFAVFFKAPVTVFLIPTLLPLIPGALLYRTFAAVFRGNLEDTLIYAASTCRTIGALVVGIMVVSAVTHVFRMRSHKKSA